jgi:hypothetical protein
VESVKSAVVAGLEVLTADRLNRVEASGAAYASKPPTSKMAPSAAAEMPQR